jgi:hypothetical protein
MRTSPLIPTLEINGTYTAQPNTITAKPTLLYLQWNAVPNTQFVGVANFIANAEL